MAICRVSTRALTAMWLLLALLLARLATAVAPANCGRTLDALLADPALHGARIGVFVQSLGDGAIWYDHHAGDLFIPASTAKLLTGALALEYLGPDYQFATRVYADGPVVDGVLHGDLYLQGGGDPTLTVDDLRALAQRLAAGDPARGVAPIRAVRGALRFDDTFFPRPGGPGALLGAGWEAEDLPWYYASPASALSCQRNAVTLTVCGTRRGQPAAVTMTPTTRLLRCTGQALTAAPPKSTLRVLPHGDVIRLGGQLAPGQCITERLSVRSPSHFTVEQFQQALLAVGIIVNSSEPGRVDARRHLLLAEHTSPPLCEIVTRMAKDSDNHTAEQLRWTLLALYSLNDPLDQRFSAMLRDFLTFSGLLPGGVQLVDGSGLSRWNGLSPLTATRILTHMALSPNYEAFYTALPIAGVDGTLRARLVGTTAQGNVRAKTGTMRGVSTLAGYVTTADGERLVFAIFVNGYRGSSAAARALQDRVAVYLAGVRTASEASAQPVTHN